MEKKEKRKIFWRNIGLIISAAILEMLAFPPRNWYWLAFIFAVPLFIFLSKENRLFYLLIGFFLYRLIFFLGTVYFVIDPFLFFFSILIFLGLPLAFYFIAKYNRSIAFFSLIILWPFFEFLEARYTALPNFISEIGNAFGSSPFLGLARLGGIAGLTVFCAALNLLVFFLTREFLKKENKRKKEIIILASFISVILFSGLIASKVLLKQNTREYESLARVKKIVLVSDSGQLDEVFKREKLSSLQLEEKAMAVAISFSEQLKNRKSISDFDLVILPEGLIDVRYDESVDQEAWEKLKIENSGILIGAYRKIAVNAGADLIANIFSRQEGKLYNTLLFFNSRGELEDIFNKETLTITGEYWPFGKWHPFYFDWAKSADPIRFENDAIFDPSKNLSRGKSKTVTLGGINLAPAICLEAHYPGKIKQRVDMGADMVVNTSSSVWISLGLKKYLSLTKNLKKIEAVWLNIPLLATGRKEDALFIAPDGRESGLLFSGKEKNTRFFIAEVKF